MGCMHPTAGYGFVLLVLFHADIPAGMAANDWPCDVQSSFLVYIDAGLCMYGMFAWRMQSKTD